MKTNIGALPKILVNASRVGVAGGLRTFAESFIRCLEGYPEVVALVPYGVHIASDVQQRLVPQWLASSGKTSILRPIVWWFYSVFLSLQDRDAAVVCTTHHVIPFRRRQIVTVHDLRPYFFPDTWVQSFYYHVVLPRVLKRCDGVMTVSAASKQSLVEVYGLRPEHVHIVSNTVDAAFFCPGQTTEAGEPYLLAVGSSWRHKNVLELLKIHRFWESSYRLKIVAEAGQYVELLKKQAAFFGLTGHIDFLTGVSRERLRSLYRGCSALVYPSLMEGFGLPPIEALACGRPVIVSDIPLFRELFGSVPIYVKLGEEESWKDALAALSQISEEKLTNGIVLARSFSAERMKRELLTAVQCSLNRSNKAL